jgi:hypothetical protein
MDRLLRLLSRIALFPVEHVIRAIFATYYVLIYYLIELPNAMLRTGSRTESGISLPTELWCIFAISQQRRISNNLIAFLVCLKKFGYNVILVNNGACSDELVKAFLPHCHTVIIKPHGGRDFGGYKWGTTFLRSINEQIRQVIYCNDSIFIRPSAFETLLMRIGQMNEDYIGITDTFATTYHVQSWFFVISERTFQSTEFQRFWQKYIPLSYRLHSIKNGEVGICQHLLKCGIYPYPLYSQGMILDMIFDGTFTDAFDRLLTFFGPEEYGGLINNVDKIITSDFRDERAICSFLKHDVMEAMGRSNTMNATNLILLNETAFPFLKKDLVYRGRYLCTQIENAIGRWIGNDAEHISEILGYIRSRGTARLQYSFSAFLVRLGVF